VTQYTACAKAIIFVVAMHHPEWEKCNPVCKLTGGTGGDESQSIA